MENLRKAVKDLFSKEYVVGHDFKHALKVSYFAKLIAKDEDYNQLEAEITGLLHDVGRILQKEHKNHGPAGLPLAKELLDKYTDCSFETKQRILYAIEHHSDKETSGKLANILQDADKLDGMGAIGVIRACVSRYYLPEYDDAALNLVEASDDPKTLYEYILYQIRWMDMFYTQSAKRIAKKRHEFMIAFLNQLKLEIEESE